MSLIKKTPFFVLVFLFIFQKSFSDNSEIYKKIDLFGEVLEKINDEYVDEIDQSQSMDAAINGLLQSLDPYSAYMTPESFKSMHTETSGEFGGLGIEVGMEAGVVKVISPIDNTPASKAGLKAGDYIVKINDTQVQGKSLTQAVELMRGPVGSSIEITVRRRGEKKALIFNITREIIEVQSVKFELLENNIGYIRLTSFNEDLEVLIIDAKLARQLVLNNAYDNGGRSSKSFIPIVLLPTIGVNDNGVGFFDKYDDTTDIEILKNKIHRIFLCGKRV